MTRATPDAAGANNVFIVLPTGFYAMMSIHAPAARGKLEERVSELEIPWFDWLHRLTGASDVDYLSCHSNIGMWAGIEWTGHSQAPLGAAAPGPVAPQHNPFVTQMLPLLTASAAPHIMGTVVFTAMLPTAILGGSIISGLDADQFATLAAAYKRAAARIVPVLYGDKVDVNGG